MIDADGPAAYKARLAAQLDALDRTLAAIPPTRRFPADEPIPETNTPDPDMPSGADADRAAGWHLPNEAGA